MELTLHAYAYCFLPSPEFPLQPSPHLTEVSKNGRKLNVGDSASCRRPTLSEASFVGEEQIIFLQYKSSCRQPA